MFDQSIIWSPILIRNVSSSAMSSEGMRAECGWMESEVWMYEVESVDG